jgi:DNA-binding transcriptional LysR family regulator
MELRRLNYFVAVAEELHFRRAAARLHIAQPALSQQVQKLELELGTQLLHRTRRGVSLTPAGAVLLEEARRLLRQAEHAANLTRGASSGAVGRLRVGYLADTVPAALPRAIEGFATRHPGVEVDPETLPARRAIEDVRSGRLDVALVSLPGPTEGLKVTPVGTETTVAAIASYLPLSGRSSIALPELAETPVVMLPRTANPAFYDGAMGACRDAGIAPRIIETHEPKVELALMIVAAGSGVALMPGSVADVYAVPGVVMRPLAPPAPVTAIALVSRPEPTSTTVEAFLRLAGGRSLIAVAAPASSTSIAA